MLAAIFALALPAAGHARAAAGATPPEPSASALDERQSTLFAVNCTQCHARAETGAPQVGDADAWRPRLAQGEDRLLANVVLGKNGMPPLGYCSACSEADLRALIRFLARQP